jgi:hypothetical protein
MGPLTEKIRRGEVRWRILQVLYTNTPNVTKQEWVVGALTGLELQTDRIEVLRELAYLAGDRKELVEEIDKGKLGIFWVLTSDGIDYMEYNIPEMPGVPRPEVD